MKEHINLTEQQRGDIDEYTQAHHTFIGVSNKFPVDKRETILFGQWSAKDILAHIIGWEWHSIQKVKAVQEGVVPVFIDNIDKYNEESVAKFRGLDWDSVYLQLLESGVDMIQTYSQVSPGLWNHQLDSNSEHTIRGFLAEETEHLTGEHLVQLKEHIPE